MDSIRSIFGRLPPVRVIWAEYNGRMIPRIATIAAATVLVFSAMPAAAQTFTLNMRNVENSVMLNVTPQHPGPNQKVHIEAASSFVDLTNLTISWYVNGKKIGGGVGSTSVDVMTGTLGSETDIRAVASGIETQASASVALVPAQMDLLWESDSFTPPYYRGRALPSPGTAIRLQVLTHFTKAKGVSMPDSDVTFTWKRNGQIIGDVSGKGKSVAVIGTSMAPHNDIISVIAISSDGSRSGEVSTVIPEVDPALMLYEDHPLFGIRFDNALTDDSSVSENEMSFAVVPYFAPIKSVTDPNLQYEWSVNNIPVSSDARQGNEITISADKSKGDAALSVALTHLTNMFVGVSGSWRVMLSSGLPMKDVFKQTTE